MGDAGAGGVGRPTGETEAANELPCCETRTSPPAAEQRCIYPQWSLSMISVIWVQLPQGAQMSQDHSFLGAYGRGQVSVEEANGRLHACVFPLSRRPGNIRSVATRSGRLGESSRWGTGVWAPGNRTRRAFSLGVRVFPYNLPTGVTPSSFATLLGSDRLAGHGARSLSRTQGERRLSHVPMAH